MRRMLLAISPLRILCAFCDWCSPDGHIIADFLVMYTLTSSQEKRRSWTDLSDHVDSDDYSKRLRNGRRMWSCEQFAGHRPALDRIGRVQLNLPGKVDPRVVAVELAQHHRDNSPSPFLFALIVPSRSFIPAQAFSASITHITSQSCRPSDPQRPLRRSLPWLACSVPVCTTISMLLYQSRKY
jgi:hypothetical protein